MLIDDVEAGIGPAYSAHQKYNQDHKLHSTFTSSGETREIYIGIESIYDANPETPEKQCR